MSKFKIKRVEGLIHIIVQCTQCNFYTEDRNEGMTKARKHAEIMGHEVRVETGHSITYCKEANK